MLYSQVSAEQEKAAVKQKAHDKAVLQEVEEFKREMGLNNKKNNQPDTFADRQTDVPKEEKPPILFDFSKYGINDVTEAEQQQANAFKNDGSDDESIIKRFWRVRQGNGGKPLDRSKPMGQTDNVIPNARYLDGDDLYLGNIGLDDSGESVIKKLGTVGMTEEKKPDGSTMYKYSHTMDVKVKDGEVIYIASDVSWIKTPRSICGDNTKDEKFNNGMTLKNNGSTLKEVINAYGRRDAIMSDGGEFDFYEYEVHSKKGHLSMIRFAVNKDNQRVQYISMRRL